MKRYLAGILLWCLPVQAQWSNDPAVNNPVFTGPYGQRGINAVSDGVAGAFAFWLNLNLDTVGIYAQRVDAGGNVVRPQPVQLFQYSVIGAVPKDAIPDGSLGAILTWSAKVSGSITDADIYAQRLDPDLNTSWANIIVCNAVNFQSRPRLASDGAGGAVIAWEDRRDAGVSRVYAQHLDSNGDSLWARNGIPLVSTTSQAHFNPMIVPDGGGGVIVVWEDIKAFQTRLYAQRLNAAGEPQWADTGAAVYFYPTGPTLRGLVEDGAGGAFVCWQDRNSHGDNNVYVQRVDAAGNRAWDPFGVKVSASNKDVNPTMIADGSGGAIIAWEDSSLGTREVNIHAQRVGPSGALLWPVSVPVSTAPFEQYYFSMIPRGNDGAIIAWTDARDWPIPPGLTGLDVYAQSLDRNGVAQWQADGAPVSQPPAAFVCNVRPGFPGIGERWQRRRDRLLGGQQKRGEPGRHLFAGSRRHRFPAAHDEPHHRTECRRSVHHRRGYPADGKLRHAWDRGQHDRPGIRECESAGTDQGIAPIFRSYGEWFGLQCDTQLSLHRWRSRSDGTLQRGPGSQDIP